MIVSGIRVVIMRNGPPDLFHVRPMHSHKEVATWNSSVLCSVTQHLTDPHSSHSRAI